MYCITLLLFNLAHSASSGASRCDALGLCALETSGAYQPTTLIRTYTAWRVGCFRIDPIAAHTTTSFEECKVICDDNPACVGFDYVTERERCEPKSTDCDSEPGECTAARCFFKQNEGGTLRPLQCPKGMNKVALPVRSDDYHVGTADHGEVGPTEYTPGELMDIHIRVLHEQKKFLGILMYAVSDDGIIGPEGCPTPGCDGSQEVKVGTWEGYDSNYKTTCGDLAVTHGEADVKNYYTKFQWRAPEAGSGDVIFRVLLKQGSTNGGNFYWPMVAGDLVLREGSVSAAAKAEWFAGSIEKTCTEVCADAAKECDATVEATGTLGFYEEEMKHSTVCLQPLLSSCARGPPSRDESSGLCWLENRDSGACSAAAAVDPANLCEAVEVAGGDQRLCPCGANLPDVPGDGGNSDGGNKNSDVDPDADSDSEDFVMLAIGAASAAAVCLFILLIVWNNKRSQEKGVYQVKRHPSTLRPPPKYGPPTHAPPTKRMIQESKSVELPPCPPPRGGRQV